MDLKKLSHDIQPETVEFRRDLHRHPEASLKEFRTTDRIAAELDKLGVPYRRLDPTGIVAEIKGGRTGKTVALRGDIDALSQNEKTGLPFASENAGMMHACGHDTHTAMLLGAVKVLNSVKNELNGNVRFIFQPAEEIGAGARLAIKQGALEGVSSIFGIHIISQMPTGVIGGNSGAMFSATDSFKIVIKGVVTHGSMPEGGVDATVAGSAMVMNIQTMVSREFSPREPIVVTVGSFHSGTRFNIVSGEAVLEGTIRCFSRETHKKLPEVLTRIAKMTAETFRATAEVEYSCLCDVLVNDSKMIDLGFAAAHKITDDAHIIRVEPTMGGEDFAEYTSCAPAAFFLLGGGGGKPQHSDYFVIREEAMETGVAFYSQLAVDALNS